MSQAFGEKLSLMIELVDVKQKELANYIGVHPSLISKCKKGERQLPRSSFERIPEALKEMGKWREAYSEPWAELWLMYLQETTAGVDWQSKALNGNMVGHHQFAGRQFAGQQFAGQQSETSTSAKQVTAAEADTSAEVNMSLRDSFPVEAGLPLPSDTVQRLSTLLKDPYSLVAILLLIVIGLLARSTSLLPVSSASSSKDEQRPEQSVAPMDDSASEDGTPSDPISWSQEKQATSDNIPDNTPDNGETETLPSLQVKWDFEADLDGWRAYSEPGAEHSINVVDGALCSEIVNSGLLPWDVTMRYDNISLSAQNVYQLAFDVATAVDRNLSLSLLEGNGSHIYSTHPLNAGTQSVEVEFRQNITDEDADLVFWIGGQLPGKVCVDNIVLSAVGTFEPRPDSGETRSAMPENLIPSADFSEGYVWGWWLHEANGAAYEMSVRDGALCATVHEPGNTIVDLTLGHRWSDFVVGSEYRLDFDVFSDGITSLRVALSDHSETLELAPDWSVAGVQYVHAEGNPNKGIRLRFGGQPNGTICFDNFLLVESAP